MDFAPTEAPAEAAPAARTSQRRPLSTSRNEYTCCGALSLINVEYGAMNAHSSSLTSLGYALRSILSAYSACQVHNTL